MCVCADAKIVIFNRLENAYVWWAVVSKSALDIRVSDKFRC